MDKPFCTICGHAFIFYGPCSRLGCSANKEIKNRLTPEREREIVDYWLVTLKLSDEVIVRELLSEIETLRIDFSNIKSDLEDWGRWYDEMKSERDVLSKALAELIQHSESWASTEIIERMKALI